MPGSEQSIRRQVSENVWAEFVATDPEFIFENDGRSRVRPGLADDPFVDRRLRHADDLGQFGLRTCDQDRALDELGGYVHD